ncbi:lysylphosphatidylglycerol synthetase-like protein (DUF2156 family) [Marmoricola sp. OAE513]|uniref:phage holin family protein n=1 Tax=Marmoricola sp. OAE513 TaxID=2817894 RepID=UPI001AE84094
MDAGFGIATGLFVIFGLFALGSIVLWLVFLIEAINMPDAQWTAAGQNKILHVVLMVVLGIIGTIIYFVTARGDLTRVGPPPPGFQTGPPGYGPPQ